MAGKRTRLAERRKSLGFTQEAFAERLDVDSKTVRRWETGETAPQPWIRTKLARLLQVSASQLDDLLAQPSVALTTSVVESASIPPASNSVLLPVLINGRAVLLPIDARTVRAAGAGPVLTDLAHLNGEATSPAVTATEWDAMSPLNRRSLLKQGLAAATLPALGLEELQRVAAAMDDARRYLDGPVIDYLRHQLALCKADDGTMGRDSTLPVVLGILGAIEEHASDVKPAVRREFLKVGAEGAEFAGWLYRDGRDMPRAMYWHDRAIEWAQEAGDQALQGYVLLKKAQLAYDEREPLRMLTLSQAVLNGSWQLPGRVLADATQQEARAEAMLGSDMNLVERKLDQARQLLGGSVNDASQLGAHYNDQLLTMQTAVCYTEAGQPRRAVALYEQALTENNFSPRDYGFFLSWMAASLALAGEPDQAAATGTASAARAREANSNRTRQELKRVIDVLQPWHNRPAVRGLKDAVLA